MFLFLFYTARRNGEKETKKDINSRGQNTQDIDDGKRTKVVSDNGFNPLWNESFDFAVRKPELANLIMIVKDKDVFSEGLIAQAGIPLRLLRPGYRVLPLKQPDGTPIAHAFLFVYVTWKRVKR